MTYLSWGVMYEGDGDAAYFDVLLPRVIEDVVLAKGIRNTTIPSAPAIRLRRSTVEGVAREACAAKEAFHLMFIHADTGGRSLAATLDGRSASCCKAMHELCDWPLARCVAIAPSHETEAWILADPEAVMSSLGFRGSPADLGLPRGPAEAERLADPKAVLASAATRARGRRRPPDVEQIFPAIAQKQSLATLRRAQPYAAFEADLVCALIDLGCVAPCG